MERRGMIDETDLRQEKKWYYENRCNTAIKNFQRKGINAQYASGRREALEAVLGMIAPGLTVFRGDSVTLDEIGIVAALAARGKNRVIDPLERKEDGSFAVPEGEQKKVARGAFSADVFLVGSNAVTLDGKLVNTDGRGNRVAPMVYGPDKVIVVAGANKVVNNLEEAFQRIRQIAAPVNARRHYLKHKNEHFGELPCVRSGNCADCNHDWRICRYTVIIEGAMLWERGRINVVLVGEELGI
jgi:hypothetical protein